MKVKALKKNWKRERKKERKRDSDQQETGSERDIYTERDIRGSTNKGGAAIAVDCGGVP